MASFSILHFEDLESFHILTSKKKIQFEMEKFLTRNSSFLHLCKKDLMRTQNANIFII